MGRESATRDEEVLKPVVRPLQKVERRILNWGMIRERRRMKKIAPLITLVTGLVIFGCLWGMTVLATKSDKNGPSWKMSGLLWLAIGIPISLWAHRDIRKNAATRDGSFANAIRMNRAVEIRIQASSVAVLESGPDAKPTYAFQLENDQIVLVRWRRSARFPNSDFSLVNLFTEKTKPVVGLIEKRGTKLEPVRRIPAETGTRLEVPEHLTVMPGRLSELEELLAAGPR